MIVVDLEFSGLDFLKCGIWQIGAVEFENPENQFFEECRIDDEDLVEEDALKVVGKTEAGLRDKNKQSQKQLLEKFFEWCRKTKIKNFMCEGPQWDMGLLLVKANKHNLEFPFHHRAFDLHSIANLRYLQVKGKLLIENDHSGMGLTNILKFCGMRDERKEHNALEDAKLTAECLSRILNGKSIFKEYEKFKLPEYLIKNKEKQNE